MLLAAGAWPAFSQTRQIIVLYDERLNLPGLAMLDAGFSRVLTVESSNRVEIYRESMDLSRFNSDSYLNLLRDHLRAKYAGKKLDVAVAVMEPALDFLLKHRDEVFPGVPIVFCGIDRKQLGGRRLPSDATGILLKREFSPTLELALRLHPETDRIVVVAGASEFDARLLEQAREEFRPFEDRLAFSYLTALPLPILLSQLSHLSPKTVVLYSTVFRDGAGDSFVPHEVAERVSATANAPVYGFLDQYLGLGIVGGRVYGLGPHGEAAAGMVVKILAGTKPSELPPVEPANSVTAFDWRQLRRWDIDESRLPPGSNVLFRKQSLWREYRFFAIGAMAVVALQAWMIGGLLLMHARRRQTESELRTIQERMTLSAEAAQLGLWTWNVSGNSLWLTDKLRELLGYSATEKVTYEGFLMRVHEEDRTAVVQAVQRAFENGGRFHSEYRVVLPDGTLRWHSGNGRVKFSPTGTPVQMLGVCIDITERHRVEEETRQVSGKLITAQEDERKRIARDLHDDLNQRLALLSVEMELFGVDSRDARGSARERLESMASKVKDLSSEVHRLSYQLHPAKLDQLGLVVAARTFCREISAQSGIPVHFQQEDVPRHVGIDVALCLYRVIQEAVQNSVRHNGGAAIHVSLAQVAQQIRLRITDEGKGFDVDHAMHNGGLGLVSMRERVRQVNGSIQISSSRGQGARIEVNVPRVQQAPA